jgi:cytochrome c
MKSKRLVTGITFSKWATGISLLVSGANAQWTYPNCAAATDADFQVTTVISRKLNDSTILEPLKMDFSANADGSVDVYYVQRGGQLKRYDGMTKLVTTLVDLPVETGNEDGMIGLALDPNFKTTNRVFLYYSHISGFRLSRFTLDAVTKNMVAGSEKILLTIPSSRGKWHTSGAMKFDAYGDLWLSVGDNETTHKGPANTKDLRGGLLRIHPEENGTYSIPKGNMWEFAADYFRGKGNTAVADQYLDSTKMKRETYVKGTRNAYTMTLDPVRRWAVYGDCGPDQESGSTADQTLWTEEQNVVTEPSYMGWPYWSSNQHVQVVFPYSDAAEKAEWDLSAKVPAAPVNTFAGVGIPQLMPAKPGTYNYAHSCAMTGPIFRYNGNLTNTTQIPPHFNRIWFTTDFNKGTIKAVKLDNDGKMVGAAVEIFKTINANFLKPLDFQQGPDGSLYYLNYSCGPWRVTDACTGIYRIDYKGACKDATLKQEQPVSMGQAWNKSMIREIDYVRNAQAFTVKAVGFHQLEVYSVSGAKVFTANAVGEMAYPIDRIFAGKQPGLYVVRLVTEQGVSTLNFPYVESASK